MKFRSERELADHLAAVGSDAQVVKRRPARRSDGAAQANVTDKRKREHPEHDQQVALIEWVRSNEGRWPVLRLFHAIPNGGYRGWITAKLMKAEGSRRGIPDLCLPCPSRGPDGSISHGLYIEMKAPGGKLSGDQKEVIALLRRLGYRVVVCYSADEAIGELLRYLEGVDSD